MSDTEIASVRERLDQQGAMMALRFAGDVLCTAEKFKAIDRAFNDDAERIRLIELPGKGHSVLTLDFIKGGQLAEDALQEVLSYFAIQLKTA